jgi:hypothetical protein
MSEIRRRLKPKARPTKAGWKVEGAGARGHGKTLDKAYTQWQFVLRTREGLSLPTCT